VALAEACFGAAQRLGAEVELPCDSAELFGEGPSTVVATANPLKLNELRAAFAPLEVTVIGRVSEKPRLIIAPGLDQEVTGLMRGYQQALPGRIGSV
jgi:hypothetical protein